MTVGFDVISDLNLQASDSFNWEGKAESLYCIIAGNVSNDIGIIRQTLEHISKFYQGVFYITGTLEYENVTASLRARDITIICQHIRNVSLLYNHVVIIDGVAILGANGWYGTEGMTYEVRRNDDITYLGLSVERLQLHLDVSRIVVVTNSVPIPDLYFGEEDHIIYDQTPPGVCLANDTMKKVTHWVFGTYKKEVDTVMHRINYINNSCYERSPYYAKRITV